MLGTPLRVEKPATIGRGLVPRVAVFMLVVLAGVGLYSESLFPALPHFDEVIYEAAAERLRCGEAPYTVPGFVYPASFAYAQEMSRAALGNRSSRLLWRWLNFLAMVWVVWESSSWGFGKVLLLKRLLLCLPLLVTPGIAIALQYGNMSLLSGALVLAGLLAVESSPVGAGAVLGLSFGIKPLMPPALAVLAVPVRGRSPKQWLCSRSLLSAVVGGLTGAVLLFGFPHWRTYVSTPIEHDNLYRSASILRLLDLLTISLPRELVLLMVYAGFMIVVWWMSPFGRERTIWSLTAVLVAVPLLWSHTVVLFLPVLVLAMRVAITRSFEERRREKRQQEERQQEERQQEERQQRGAVGSTRTPWWADATVISCLVGALLFFESANLDLLPSWIQIVLILPPLVFPILLALYLTSPRQASSARNGRVGSPGRPATAQFDSEG